MAELFNSNSGGKKMNSGSHEVTIRDVHWNENFSVALVHFEDSTVSIEIRSRSLAKRGIDAQKSIVPGKKILIKGKNGNEDANS